jgi:hypothetical protein
MSFKFKPMDFALLNPPPDQVDIAKRANQLLDDHVKTLNTTRYQGIDHAMWPIDKVNNCFHGIGRIIWASEGDLECECDKCGAILRPTGWEVKT